MNINIYFCDFFSYLTHTYLLTNKILPTSFLYFVDIENIAFRPNRMSVQLIIDIALFKTIYNDKKEVDILKVTSYESKRFLLLKNSDIINLLDRLNDHKSFVLSYRKNEIDNIISVVTLALYND